MHLFSYFWNFLYKLNLNHHLKPTIPEKSMWKVNILLLILFCLVQFLHNKFDSAKKNCPQLFWFSGQYFGRTTFSKTTAQNNEKNNSTGINLPFVILLLLLLLLHTQRDEAVRKLKTNEPVLSAHKLPLNNDSSQRNHPHPSSLPLFFSPPFPFNHPILTSHHKELKR